MSLLSIKLMIICIHVKVYVNIVNKIILVSFLQE